MGGGEAAACSELPHLPFRARKLRAPQLGMGWVKLVLGVGVAAYSYRSVTHVNSLVRQVTVPKYSLLAKHTQVAQNGVATRALRPRPCQAVLHLQSLQPDGGTSH